MKRQSITTKTILTAMLLSSALGAASAQDIEREEGEGPHPERERVSIGEFADAMRFEDAGLLRLDLEVYRLDRKPRRGIETDKMDLLPESLMKDEEFDDDQREDAKIPDIGSLDGLVGWEFYSVDKGATYEAVVPLQQLAELSREMHELANETDKEGEPVDERTLRSEGDMEKSWSNATDNRIRRGTSDGWSDTNHIYQRLANYGGCSATVLSANYSRLIAITAGHCVFTAGNNFNYSKVAPRENGSPSPTWGTWTPYAFGYYSGYLNNDCEDNWNGNDCIKHDIALVFASRDSGAQPPMGMGWGYRPKSFLDGHSKYRRGYPGCSFPHSPAGCTTDNLYGDGLLSVGSFSKKAGGWNRVFRFSSDANPGDSGSGLYYYRNGFPYVFGVTSAEPSNCKTSCTSSRPNYGRRITPDFYDFINSVM